MRSVKKQLSLYKGSFYCFLCDFWNQQRLSFKQCTVSTISNSPILSTAYSCTFFGIRFLYSFSFLAYIFINRTVKTKHVIEIDNLPIKKLNSKIKFAETTLKSTNPNLIKSKIVESTMAIKNGFIKCLALNSIPTSATNEDIRYANWKPKTIGHNLSPLFSLNKVWIKSKTTTTI